MSAEQGYTPALLGLGMMLTVGKGVPQDYEEAFAWLHRQWENKMKEVEGDKYCDNYG